MVREEGYETNNTKINLQVPSCEVGSKSHENVAILTAFMPPLPQ